MVDRLSSRRGTFTTLAACSVLALLLSACESTGGSRFGSVGAGGGSPGGDSGAGGGTGGGGSGNSGGSGGTGSGSGGSGSGTGSGGTGGGTGTGGTGSGASGGTLSTALGQVSPVLVTAGNAVLGVSNGQGGVTTPVATALPVLQPVTGTITRVLTDAGSVLVDAGEGRTLLLQGAQGVVGDLVSIDVGSKSVITGLNGSAGAVGVGVLGATQPAGTVATVGVLNAGNSVLAAVNGVADIRVTNITSPTGGVANNLLNVALGGQQLIGNGSPAVANANVLPNGLALPGTRAAGGVLAPVTSVAKQAVGGILTPVTSVVQETTGSVVGGALAPISAGVGATSGGASAGAGAVASPNGIVAPVTGAVGQTVNALGSSLGLTRP